MKTNTPNQPTPNAPPYKSTGERMIAAALTQYGVPFTYEPTLTLHDGTRQRRLRPDFHLPSLDTYIEYYGRVGNTDYDQRTQHKQQLYEANKINVIALYPWDLCQKWPASLTDRLAENGWNTPEGGYRAKMPRGYSRARQHGTY